jgi:hypothetical protein
MAKSKNYLKNTVAILVGIVIGSLVNMELINMSSSIIAPPKGAIVTTVEGLKASMHLFQPKHFLFPFLAHALGTLVGSILSALIAPFDFKKRAAYIIGVLFLIGGITNIIMLPSPIWFTIVDLLVAYIPMSYLAYSIVVKK